MLAERIGQLRRQRGLFPTQRLRRLRRQLGRAIVHDRLGRHCARGVGLVKQPLEPRLVRVRVRVRV